MCTLNFPQQTKASLKYYFHAHPSIEEQSFNCLAVAIHLPQLTDRLCISQTFVYAALKPIPIPFPPTESSLQLKLCLKRNDAELAQEQKSLKIVLSLRV